MKIFKTSYYKKEIEREMNELAGKSYSFIDRIKMKGIGSKRLKVYSASQEIKIALNADYYISLVSLEIRPKALMIYFRKKIDNYTCVAPFSALEIGKTGEVNDKEYVKLVCGNQFIILDDDRDFFDKLKTYQKKDI